MPAETNFWTNLTPKFKLIHFFIGIISLVLIIISSLYIYKHFFPRSFLPDINEQTQIPPDIQKLEDLIQSRSPQAATAEALLSSGYIKSKKAPPPLRVPILLYHYIEYVKNRNDKLRIALNIEPFILDTQIKTLKDAGYTFITPDQIPSLLEEKLALPQKPVILTFDDGYRDFYTDAFPVIKKYQARVVAYIVPGFLDHPNYLTHKQLKEIADSGLVEIAAHTVHHSYLKGLNEKRLDYEIAESKKMLEKELNTPIISFAYPYGAFDLNTIQAVKKAGFRTAVSTVPGTEINLDNLFFIYRLRPGARTKENLLRFLEQAK